MSTAAEKAEARRKAILSRGSDRLAKLTTSARGEDATYLRPDTPATHTAALNNFVGESPNANMPKPAGLENIRRVSPSLGPPLYTTTSPSASESTAFRAFEVPDSDVWMPEHQQKFMQALLTGAQQSGTLPEHSHARRRKISQSSSEGKYPGSREGSVPPPFDTTLASMFPTGPAGMNVGTTEGQKPKSLLKKLIPVTHMLAMWCLLLWFVIWGGGKYSYMYEGAGSSKQRFWERWADLGDRTPQLIQQSIGMNFFWAFATLQIVLHSIRLFSGFDALQPPALLSLALPHLPQQISALVVNGLRYLQMGSMLLDDIAWLIVGLGFLIYVATWVTL
ncbi:hypothetical protein AX15_001483 [Amanita polypyramis BW_CC]|nr:hypothetical protein AX15_001483 [Amanita polypyramis BW_CC]